MIQFASGGTCTTAVPHTCTLNFTIPANSTIPAPSTFTVLTGTTAGTITLTTSLTSGGVALTAPTPTKIVNNSGVPFISSVSFQQTPGGITVTVVGFSSTRDMVSGLFHFAPATNVTFSSSDITVPLATPFSTWWGNTAQSNPYGTQFTLTAPFSSKHPIDRGSEHNRNADQLERRLEPRNPGPIVFLGGASFSLQRRLQPASSTAKKLIVFSPCFTTRPLFNTP